LIPAFRSFSMGGLRGLEGPGPGTGGFPIIPNSLALTIMLAILFILLYYSEYILASLFIRAVGKSRKDRYVMSGAMASLVMVCIVTGLQILSLILSVALAAGGNMGRGTFIVI